MLKRFALCEFLLKMLYANTFLLSGRKKVGHISWFMGLYVNPFQAPLHTRVDSLDRSSSALAHQPAQSIRIILVPKKLQLYTLKGNTVSQLWFVNVQIKLQKDVAASRPVSTAR